MTFHGWTATGVVSHIVRLDTQEGMQSVTLPESFSEVTSITWGAAGRRPAVTS